MLYSILLLILIILAVSLHEKKVEEYEHFQNIENQNCYGSISSKMNDGKNKYYTNFMTATYTNFDKLFKYFKKKTNDTISSLKDYKSDLDEAYNVDNQTTRMLIDTQDRVENTSNILKNMVATKINNYDNEKQNTENKLQNISNTIESTSNIKKEEVMTNVENVVMQNARDEYNKYETSVINSDEIRKPFDNVIHTMLSTQRDVQAYNWQCEPGIIGAPIRINASNNSIECLSKDGSQCDTNYCNNNDVRDIDHRNAKSVKCNDRDMANPEHWCNKAAKTLYDLDNTDYSLCPKNWTMLDKKNMICKAPVGYNGSAQPNQMANQYKRECANANCQILNMSAADKRQWSRGNNTWFPQKVNIINKSIEMTDAKAQLDNVLKQTIGTSTPPSRIDNYKVNKNGVVIKAYKLNVSGGSYTKGKPIYDSVITSHINYRNGSGTILGIRPSYSDPNINHNSDDLYIVFTGYIKVPKLVSIITFRTISDDGVRFMIKKPNESSFNKIIDDFSEHAEKVATSALISVQADSFIEYELEYFERGGASTCVLQWSLNNDGRFDVISRGAFFLDNNKCSDKLN